MNFLVNSLAQNNTVKSLILGFLFIPLFCCYKQIETL